MRTSRRFLLGVVVVAWFTGCDDYLTTQPQTILTDDQVWTDPRMILSVIADIYSRLPEYEQLDTGHGVFTSYDDAIWSGNTTGDAVNQLTSYDGATWSFWDYTIIRDINLAIASIQAAQTPILTPEVKTQLVAELRFQRAYVYFQMVRAMGGVPLVTEQMIYDFSGDPSYLQLPRATEAAVYDFIGSEMDAIVDQLGNASSQTRANRFTALALKSRAMLYAGSLARHNNEMAGPITLAGGEVGIPAARAADYYRKSLEASRAILTSGRYTLRRTNSNLGLNFYQAVSVKAGNTEVIWAKDYAAGQGSRHYFTVAVMPRSLRLDAVATLAGASITPTLQLVEAFDYLDGSPGQLRGVGTGSNTAAGQAGWVFYDNPEDIFANKDARLFGTVLYPNVTARGSRLDIQAGVYVWNQTTGKYDRTQGSRDSNYTDSQGRVWRLTGSDGPVGVEQHVTSTGFYLRKYLDETQAAGTGAVGSDMWWVRFRLGEIYLNAAEAAFELGETGEALGYINTLRERAGFRPNSLTSLTRDRIRNERRVELAFEGHRLWDLKRWRIAHLLWDGSANSATAYMDVLWPYRVIRPGHSSDGKWVYDKFRALRQTAPRYFQMFNYYSSIPAAARSNNRKLIENPGL
jgi:hypothetical protein